MNKGTHTYYTLSVAKRTLSKRGKVRRELLDSRSLYKRAQNLLRPGTSDENVIRRYRRREPKIYVDLRIYELSELCVGRAAVPQAQDESSRQKSPG